MTAVLKPVPAPAAPDYPTVKIAHLQSGISIEGHCSVETNFNPIKFPKLKMHITPTDLVLEFGDGKAHWVPRPNVKVLQFG